MRDTARIGALRPSDIELLRSLAAGDPCGLRDYLDLPVKQVDRLHAARAAYLDTSEPGAWRLRITRVGRAICAR